MMGFDAAQSSRERVDGSRPVLMSWLQLQATITQPAPLALAKAPRISEGLIKDVGGASVLICFPRFPCAA